MHRRINRQVKANVVTTDDDDDSIHHTKSTHF